MGDLGNLSDFLKEGSVADLQWLDVNEEQYRKEDTLPKQNLDIQPDLEALWAREDKPATNYLIPNTGPVPSFEGAGELHTMGDMSQAHGSLRARAEEIRKVARLALMQSTNPGRLKDALVKRFDLNTLQDHRQVLAEVLQERGLLGKYYIAASDFPGCHTGSAGPSQFVRRYAGDAKFVLAKGECASCIHARKPQASGSTCAVFHKEIQLQIPYSDALAQVVETSQTAMGKEVQASTASPKERIRLAMLAKDGTMAPAVSVYTGSGLPMVSIPIPMAPEVAQERLIQANDLLLKNRRVTQDDFYARPVVAFLKREMVKGLSPEDLVKSLRLAFNQDDLKKTRAHWEPIFKEAGLYGVIYSTQDSFDDCHTGADFLAKYNPGVRAIVAGDKCSSCIYAKGRCLMYGKPLVKDAAELYTPETVDAVLVEHRTAGRLPAWETKAASFWGSDSREALKAIHKAASAPQAVHQSPTRMDVMKGFYGTGSSHITSGMTRREIVKQASKFMNEGLYGRDLLHVLKSRYEERDLTAATEDLRGVIAEQGLQGIYYVDASVYDDYGKGCDEAARLHRSRLVPYIKLGSKCGSCVLQSRPGFCSKLNKPLVVEPPYVDKLAQQREILASGPATETVEASLMNSGLPMMVEYQMQNGGMEVEVREASVLSPIDFEFNNQKPDL